MPDNQTLFQAAHMMSLIASVIRRRLQAARYQLSFHSL